MELKVGARISWSGQVGVVLDVDGDFADVSVPTHGVVTVPCVELEAYGEDPIAALLAGELGDSASYCLRLQAEFLRHAYRFDPLAGLSNARVEPKSHQVYVAHRVTRKPAPRMILADEVGLGKTIEAGLILKELRARDAAERTLIATPANLMTQWQRELATKFNEDFTIIDGDAARHFGRDGGNPFAASDSVLTSIPFASREVRRDQIAELEWNLVIFDEAHRVRSGPGGRTRAYELAERLRDHVHGLLLLTATPMQLSTEELWALIDLVEPGLYPSTRDYERVRRQFPDLNELMRSVRNWEALELHERDRLQHRHERLLDACGVSRRELGQAGEASTREVILDRIAGHHHLADVLVRNRRRDVGGFTERTATRHLVTMTPEEQDAYEAVTDYLRNTYKLAEGGNTALGFLLVTYHKMLSSSSAAIYRSLNRRLDALRVQLADHNEYVANSGIDTDERRDIVEGDDAVAGLDGVRNVGIALETEIIEVEALVARLGKLRDSKARRAVELADEMLATEDEKVLIFTQFLETQRLLERALRARGYSVEVFNGRMKAAEKDAAVERFRRSAQVLISTEAGGEGRNLQFCHLMINYDLPWNPMKVEQRIGRIDRIGQERPVVIYNLANAGTIEERVLQVLSDRIRLFEESIGSLDPILGDVERDLEGLVLLAQNERDRALGELEVDLERRVKEAILTEDTLRDFALEHNSFRRDETNRLLGRQSMANADDLRRFVGDALQYEGGMLAEEVDGRSSITLSSELGARLRTSSTATHRGTFDPAAAIREEQWDFFAMGHDLIDGLLAQAREGVEGRAGVRVRPGLPEPICVEVIYEIQVGGLQHRGELHHHIVTSNLAVQEFVQKGPFEGAPATHPVVVPPWASHAVEASRELAQKRLQGFRRDAVAEFEDLRSERLERLRRVHEHKVRQSEEFIRRTGENIGQLESSGDEESRRILPAWRARLRRAEARIEELGRDLVSEQDRVQGLSPAISLRVVAAGLVVEA